MTDVRQSLQLRPLPTLRLWAALKTAAVMLPLTAHVSHAQIAVLQAGNWDVGAVPVYSGTFAGQPVVSSGGMLNIGVYSFQTTAQLLSAFSSDAAVANGTLALTSGRTVEGIGGATFYYNSADTTTADNGGTIRVDVAGRRWYAIPITTITPELFGAFGDGSTDDTAAFNAAIVWGSSAGLNSVVVLCSGSKNYVIGQVLLRTNVRINGNGCKFTALTGTPFVFGIPIGPVVRSGISYCTINADGVTANQHGMYFFGQASSGSPFNGGIWYSQFAQVVLNNFTGYSIWLRGGTPNFLLPNQFLSFSNVTAFRKGTSNATERALLMTGQCDQIYFENCEFDGVTQGVGGNVEIGREWNNSGTIGGISVGGSPVSANAPNFVRFTTCTTQNAANGVIVDVASNIDCDFWWENLWYAYLCENSALGNTVGGHFANAGADGSGGGWCIKISVTSDVSVNANSEFIGTIDKIAIGSSQRGARIQGSYSNADATGFTSGITVQKGQTVGASTSTLVTAALTSVAINAPASYDSTHNITGITSALLGGQEIVVKALGTSVFATGGNLAIANNLVLRANDAVIFQRQDLGADKFVPVGKAIARLAAASSPVSGYYEEGEFVWNTAPVVSGGKILLGWTCTTGGTSAVFSPFYGTNS